MNEWKITKAKANKKEILTVSLYKNISTHIHISTRVTFLPQRNNLHIISCHLRFTITKITPFSKRTSATIIYFILLSMSCFEFMVRIKFKFECVCMWWPAFNVNSKHVMPMSKEKKNQNCKFSFDNRATMIWFVVCGRTFSQLQNGMPTCWCDFARILELNLLTLRCIIR